MSRTSNFESFLKTTLLPFITQFPLSSIKSKDNINLFYRHYFHKERQNNEKRELIILVNGRAENILKWGEVAYDFYQQGYDVLSFDHRGQGYSQRLLVDIEKGHIQNFMDYLDDMHKILQKVTALFDYSAQFIIAHSLGGLISTLYLGRYPHKIQRAIFFSPFYGIPLKKPRVDKLIVSTMCLAGFGKQYVWGKGRYHPIPFTKNNLTSCQPRIRWMNKIIEMQPALKLGGPTFQWVNACFSAFQLLPESIANINLPILIFYAGNESIVDNSALMSYLPLFDQVQYHCINNASHEILFEEENIRQNVLQKSVPFLQKMK